MTLGIRTGLGFLVWRVVRRYGAGFAGEGARATRLFLV